MKLPIYTITDTAASFYSNLFFLNKWKDISKNNIILTLLVFAVFVANFMSVLLLWLFYLKYACGAVLPKMYGAKSLSQLTQWMLDLRGWDLAARGGGEVGSEILQGSQQPIDWHLSSRSKMEGWESGRGRRVVEAGRKKWEEMMGKYEADVGKKSELLSFWVLFMVNSYLSV